MDGHRHINPATTFIDVKQNSNLSILWVEFFAFIKGAALSMGKSLYCAIHEEKERIIIKSFTNDFDKVDMTDLLEEVVEW